MGTTAPTSTVAMFLEHRDISTAMCTIDLGTIGLEPNQTPLPDMWVGGGTFGTEELRVVIEAENERVRIPVAFRWLGRPADVKARFKEEKIVHRR